MDRLKECLEEAGLEDYDPRKMRYAGLLVSSL
jgi:hypothetical protein